MASQKELMNLLQECVKTEEGAFILYTQCDSNPEFLADVEEKTRKRVKSYLGALRTGSEGHKAFFENLLNSVRSSLRNVY